MGAVKILNLPAGRQVSNIKDQKPIDLLYQKLNLYLPKSVLIPDRAAILYLLKHEVFQKSLVSTKSFVCRFVFRSIEDQF
jgi:hypothetical protein